MIVAEIVTTGSPPKRRRRRQTDGRVEEEREERTEGQMGDGGGWELTGWELTFSTERKGLIKVETL